MAKQIIHDEKSGIFKFRVCYMKYPMLENIRHIDNRLLIFFNMYFNKKHWKLSNIF